MIKDKPQYVFRDDKLEMAETYIAHEEARIAEESDEAEATNVERELVR